MKPSSTICARICQWSIGAVRIAARSSKGAILICREHAIAIGIDSITKVAVP